MRYRVRQRHMLPALTLALILSFLLSPRPGLADSPLVDCIFKCAKGGTTYPAPPGVPPGGSHDPGSTPGLGQPGWGPGQGLALCTTAVGGIQITLPSGPVDVTAGVIVPCKAIRAPGTPGTPSQNWGGFNPYGISVNLIALVNAPPIVINRSPGAVGLVSLPVWLWLTGYAGQPLTATQSQTYQVQTGSHCADPFGEPDPKQCNRREADYTQHTFVVALSCVPASYHWYFGDPRPLVGQRNTLDVGPTDLGQAYPPGPSDITHTYEHSSGVGGATATLPTGALAPAFWITTTAIWSCSYTATDNGQQVAGGPLGQATRTYGTTYAVYQERGVISGANGGTGGN